MEPTNTQLLFFQHIKGLLPQHLSLVDEVAELLHISTDSAYRRIRGEKGISMEEMQVLASHFKISIDQFLHIQTDSFLFSGRLAGAKEFVYEQWMEGVLQQVSFFNSFEQKHLYYLAKDLPLMQQFLSPDLLAFKSFLWRKSILQYDTLKGVKFRFDDLDERHLDLGRRIVEIYNTIPSTEIWNIESINSTIRQIEFYREANVFESPEDVARLYRSVLGIIDHLEKQAESGLKFFMGEKPRANAAAYNLFNNEMVLGDNTIFVELDKMQVTILTHSTINFISTRDERFCHYMQHSLQNLIAKSAQLSRVGEKERLKFFNRLREKVRTAARL